MRLYTAAVYTSNFDINGNLFRRLSENEKYHRTINCPWILESYYYIKGETSTRKLKKDNIKIFLDSGAFSAFTKGIKIDIDEYCTFIKKNLNFIDIYAVLDSIHNPLKTWQNQLYMEQQGLNPMPCFHYGEDERYLEHYVKKYNYIALGGAVPISTKNLILWLDHIWFNYLLKKDGSPKVKVHGFGITAMTLLKRYPWFSIDSSSWQQIGSMGGLFFPQYGTVQVSINSPKRKKENAHYDTCSTLQQNAILKFIKEWGFEIKRLQYQYVSRWTFNLFTYNLLSKQISNKQKYSFQKSLFI